MIKKEMTTILALLLCVFATAQQVLPSKEVFLNKSNFVFLIFEKSVSDVKFDCEAEDTQVEQLGNKSIGLRFSGNYQPPEEGLGGMIVLDKQCFQPVWLRFSTSLPTTHILFAENPVKNDSLAANQKTQQAADSSINRHIPLDIQEKGERLLNEKRRLHRMGEKESGIEVLLYNIGVTDKHLYFSLLIDNSSGVNYSIDFQGFRVDKKKGQNGDMVPVQYVYNEVSIVPSQTAIQSVLVLDLFTLRSDQYLFYVLKEQNGGRSISLSIPARYLTKQCIAL